MQGIIVETAARRLIRQKLDAFIADIPPYDGQIPSGTPVIPKPMLTAGALQAAKLHNTTDDRFFRYTGQPHIGLLEDWAGTSIRTTCNEFVGKCGRVMGATMNVGQFEIQKILAGMGKGHAWISASSGDLPRYGDVFRPNGFHMGVSLEVFGGGWWTVESGQGGPQTGCDILKRKIGFFHPANLRGWVDMELLIDDRPPVPEWLLGYWTIFGYDWPYCYFFDRYYRAAWGLSPSGPFVPGEIAAITLPSANSASVLWKSGTRDDFRHTWDGMKGLSIVPQGTPGELRCVRL